ncbi:adenylate/guanylate cyclase domain-containing protein [Thermodesulfomicrobium sp. WS]|uniref:adenylate/guanylate cyclase domain-containing protein n=1 Tax=Thermodesulfomicrobium sp. WS TaxID=3004129 RepID=UPI0024930075|nr:adenylate/guanylate cyclase domain-containing protein [Thermodesulfomicrobium sp. WS]
MFKSAIRVVQPMDSPSPSPLETRITGSFATRFWLELCSNSAHFPIVNILLEILIERPQEYLRAPDLYVILTASMMQAYWLTRWQTTAHPRRFWGNLIGPALYTLVESLLEGPGFFSSPHHLIYWIFAFTIGSLQTIQHWMSSVFSAAIIVIENVTRTSIIFFIMYGLFEKYTNPQQVLSLDAFFRDPSHQFIGLVVLFLGISTGIANLTAQRYLSLLKETSLQLRTYSEWLFGRDLLGKTFLDPSTLNLERRERAVLFMDIRGFTHWSESQSPESVVNLITEYYQIAESVLSRHKTIKFKLSADEVMAVFPTANSAVRAAMDLRTYVNHALAKKHISAGIGIHIGPVVEGLLGSMGVKFYDVIGDTVNTAKRIESAAQPGEVLLSEDVQGMMEETVATGPRREIRIKGKDNPLAVYPLEFATSLSPLQISPPMDTGHA